MEYDSASHWRALERWSPTLFLVGFGLELIFAVNHGVAYLVDGVAFIDWVYPTVLLGRLAVLLALAGLSVQIVNRHARVGKLSRGVVTLAAVFTIGLATLSILDIVGITTSIITVFGLGTVILTILTFFLYGIAIIRTGAYAPHIGGLLVLASLTVLGVFIGLRFLPTSLMGSVGEGVNAVLFLAIWFSLRAASRTTERAGSPTETIAK